MIEYLITWVMAMAPISEARGAILYGLSAGLDPGVVLTTSIFFNCLAVPIIFWFLDKSHFHDLAMRLFGKKMKAKIDRNKKRFEIYEELALLLFVAVPLPVTGAWTGVFIANILGLDRKKALPVIFLGVVIASVIVFISAKGLLFIGNYIGL